MLDLIRKIAASIFDEDERPLFDAPFTYNGKTYLTDTKILLVFNLDSSQEYPLDLITSDTMAKRLKALVKQGELTCEPDRPLGAEPIQKPEHCDEKWLRDGACELCEGVGFLECNLGHDHDCEDCDGSGMGIVVDETATESVEVAGCSFARFYVWILQQLPNVKTNIPVKATDRHDAIDHPLEFTFDGGCGKLAQKMEA